jgi:hypothetical protein
VTFALPATLTLPSGKRITLRARAAEGSKAGLFDAAIAVAEIEGGSVEELSLADFHVVRAALAKAGAIDEEAIDLTCRNCGVAIEGVHASAGLEIAPYLDGELDDPELDALPPPGVPIETRPIAVGRARVVRSVTFDQRTVREAKPMFDALTKDPLVIDARFVNAMGLTALGKIVDPERIARALERADDASFGVVTDAFLEAHYPLRLACDVFCPSCGARNTVDVPPVREFDRSAAPPEEVTPLLPIDAFVERVHAIGDPLLADLPDEVELVVSDDTPAVDDGGEPLLGSYEPPPPRDALAPQRAPTITIYYRTFAAIEAEEGPFDWEAEVRETIEHELEHHVYWARGEGDPMDDEERAEIAREVVRVVGRGEATRRTFASFTTSLGDFFRRAWPLVALGLVALLLTLAQGHCSD